MTKSLYELSGEYYEALLDLTDPENNYPADAIADTLESLSGDLQDKAINVAKFIRNLETEAEAIKAAEVAMAKRRKALEAQTASLKSYLKNNLERVGMKAVKCPFFVVSIAKNPASLDVFDEDAIPDQYKSQQIVYETTIDKAAIKLDIAAGLFVPGAKIINGTRLTIK